MLPSFKVYQTVKLMQSTYDFFFFAFYLCTSSHILLVSVTVFGCLLLFDKYIKHNIQFNQLLYTIIEVSSRCYNNIAKMFLCFWTL